MKKNVVKKIKKINLRLNHFKYKFNIKSVHNTKKYFFKIIITLEKTQQQQKCIRNKKVVQYITMCRVYHKDKIEHQMSIGIL